MEELFFFQVKDYSLVDHNLIEPIVESYWFVAKVIERGPCLSWKKEGQSLGATMLEK